MFSLSVRYFAQQVVVAEIKDRAWKQEVESLAKDSFAKAKTGWHFDSLSALESDEMSITDTLQVDLVSEINTLPINTITYTACYSCKTCCIIFAVFRNDGSYRPYL